LLVKTAAAAAFAGILMADPVTAFGGAMPSMRLASSGPTSACLSMSASKVSSDVAAISAAPSEEGATATRRHAIKSLGALAASVVFRDAAFAAGPAIADDDDDEADGEGQGAQQRKVTLKVSDDTCEKHPTWKQCRAKAKKGPSANAERQKLDSGLAYSEIAVGKGFQPGPGDTVTVHYSLYYKGDEIESSRESQGLAAKPLGFQYGTKSGAGSVMPALALGIEGMKVGGIRRVVAPPEFAFGKKGFKPRIPPDATVEFDIQLLTVKRAGSNPISRQGGGSEKSTGLFDLF